MNQLISSLFLALCAGAVLFWSMVLRPAAARVDEWQARTALLHEPPWPSKAVRRPEVRLAPEASFPDVLARLARAAQEAELAFDEGSYQVARLPHGSQVRYEITLPLHGTYPQLRSFVDGIGAALPALAIEDIRLQRRSIDDPALDARLRLALLMEAGP